MNTEVVALFMIGSAGFAVGSVPAYASAVGTTADALTFFVSSIFFTSASFGQLVQAASPALTATGTAADEERQPPHARAWLPHDRNWVAAATQFPGTLFFNVTTFLALAQGLTAEEYDRVVWRPDFYGSVLFLVSSAFAILALGRFLAWRPRQAPWWIAWLNMVGSIAFMASAVGAYILPKTSAEIDPVWANVGTFVGAVCFFVGAGLMIPAWKRAASLQSMRRADSPAETAGADTVP
ncbi:MAG TPA: hypothetical protein VJ787_04900 [Thermoleophilia bacterium]|nr:hypothetical protein [Thermoleophilia bacterium]